MPCPPEILSQKIIAQSRLFRVEGLHLRFSNGVERDYERLLAAGRGAVMVVPVINDDTFVLIREYAAGTERYELAFPKGLVEPDETAMEAANRELKEETGFGAHTITPLKTMSLAPGYLSHNMRIFMAKDLYPEKLAGDEPEPIEVVHWPVADYAALIAQEDFTEARSIAALYLAMEALNA